MISLVKTGLFFVNWLNYGFCKKSLRKNATLNSWTLFSSQKGTCTQNPYFRYLKVLKRGRGVVENTTDVIYGRPLSWLRFPTTLKAIDWTSKVLSTPSFLMYPISVNSFDPPLNSFLQPGEESVQVFITQKENNYCDDYLKFSTF